MQYGKYGKPYLKDVYFNLSHSGNYAICALSEREIGCDIQKIKPINRRLLQKCYSLSEQRYVLQPNNEKEQEERYISIWTLKESYLKKRGLGLTKKLDDISFDIKDEKIVVWDEGCKRQERFQLLDYEGYRIALCGEEDSLEMKCFSL